MTVMETFAVVITETVYIDIIAQPFQISPEHLLHVRIRMIPVTRCRIVGFVAVTVVRVSRRRTLTCTGSGIRIHLVRAADITAVRTERTVFTEIIRGKITPSLCSVRVVNHDISYHTRSVLMERADQLFQLGRCTPVAVQTAVINRMVARSAGRFTHRRQPNQVKPLTNLCSVRSAVAVQMIDPFRTTIPLVLITVPIECLQQHVRTLCRSRTAIRRTSTAVFRRTYIHQITRFHTQLDVEIILPGFLARQLTGIFAAFKTLILAIRIQIYHPGLIATLVDQLNDIAYRKFNTRSLVLYTSLHVRISKQRSILYLRTVNLETVRAVLTLCLRAYPS